MLNTALFEVVRVRSAQQFGDKSRTGGVLPPLGVRGSLAEWVCTRIVRRHSTSVGTRLIPGHSSPPRAVHS